MRGLLPSLAVALSFESPQHSFLEVAYGGASVAVERRSFLHSDVAPVDSTSTFALGVSNGLSQSVSFWLAEQTPPPPSKDDVLLLRSAFAEFYGANRDIEKSEELLTEAISRWKTQPSDERASLHRVRGDCYMLMGDAEKAIEDYSEVIRILDSPSAQNADPSELPGALFGRARSLKSLGQALKASEAAVAASDYKRALTLSSREDWDTEEELLEDGASRNPYAAWEWGSVLRVIGDWEQASKVHSLAARSFEEIGDRARSSISALDAAIDLAAAARANIASAALKNAIAKTKAIESSDASLLQHVVAKEGEARMALASILWANGQYSEAEGVLSDACVRMEQLEVDSSRRLSNVASDERLHLPLKFSIDDGISTTSFSCSKFKDANFVSQLGWSINLQAKLNKLQTLKE